jgi:hypothetical protein
MDKLPDEESAFLWCYRRVTRKIKSRSKRWAGHVASKGKKTNACKVLVGRSEGKMPT